MVVWQSDGQDGSSYGVFGQRYGEVTNTPTQTPTETPTSTPTVTPTQTPAPGGAVMTGGVVIGSARVFCHGAANVLPPLLEIWSAGPNGVVDDGTGDDQLLGDGGTDAQGNCQSSPGIGLSRPLLPGELVFAFDQQNNRLGPPAVAMGNVPVPTVGGWGLLGVVLSLLTVAVWSLWRQRRGTEP